jgi:hypothetical protein
MIDVRRTGKGIVASALQMRQCTRTPTVQVLPIALYTSSSGTHKRTQWADLKRQNFLCMRIFRKKSAPDISRKRLRIGAILAED